MVAHLQIASVENRKRHWQEILADSIVSADQLAGYLPIDIDRVQRVIDTYPMKINRHMLALIKQGPPAIARQAVPDVRELDENGYSDDPMAEQTQRPACGIIHRYPDRALLMVSNQCAMYCRFCFRKRHVGRPGDYSERAVDAGIAYIAAAETVREVILSGGDPFLLETERIDEILKRLRAVPHVEVIRIHTRTPGVLPQRISANLIQTLKRYRPIFVNIHVNHPAEITAEAATACGRLADAGIPLGSQTVLLKGINDNAAVLTSLMRRLLTIRVKPYYLHHCDPARGTGHFRTSIRTGLNIMRNLRGHISGLCLPHYMIDLPDGGGKVPLLPEYVKKRQGDCLIVENHTGKTYRYRLD